MICDSAELPVLTPTVQIGLARPAPLHLIEVAGLPSAHKNFFESALGKTPANIWRRRLSF
jgi:hypothetical protein